METILNQDIILGEFYRIGDFLHIFAVLLLISKIITSRSCYSISGLTMILYTIVFSCRYLDLYPFYPDESKYFIIYVTVVKIYFLLSSCLIVFLIYSLFRKTRDKLNDTFPIIALLLPAYIFNWVTTYLMNEKDINKDYFWRFSIYLEVVAILPQLRLIHKQGTIDKGMACYLLMLGSYRACYIVTWIYCYTTKNFWNPIVYCGCVQTIIYVLFAIWIYPRLNNENKYQTIEVTNECIKVADTNQKANDNMSSVNHV